MKQYGYAQLTVSVILLAASVSFADEYSWDQTNDEITTGGHGIQAFSPIGQEFIPCLNCLEVVQLYIMNESGDSEFVVKIYSDSITGTLLGTSIPVAVSGFYLDSLTFTFQEIPLTPQNQYVMEILQPIGTSGSVLHTGSSYQMGCEILSGVPYENMDLWFREGMFSGSAMERLSWGSIKGSF